MILPRLPETGNTKSQKIKMNTFIYLYFTYYWVINIAILNFNETIPYLFLNE